MTSKTNLRGKISAGPELFEEGRQEEGGEEEDDRPKENVWDEWTATAAGRANELPTKRPTLLQGQRDGRVNALCLLIQDKHSSPGHSAAPS